MHAGRGASSSASATPRTEEEIPLGTARHSSARLRGVSRARESFSSRAPARCTRWPCGPGRSERASCWRRARRKEQQASRGADVAGPARAVGAAAGRRAACHLGVRTSRRAHVRSPAPRLTGEAARRSRESTANACLLAHRFAAAQTPWPWSDVRPWWVRMASEPRPSATGPTTAVARSSAKSPSASRR